MTAGAEVLNQDEIDALLRGVDSNDVVVETGTPMPGTVQPYDMATQARVVRARMPGLDMINERFARFTRTNLSNMIRRSTEITVAPVKIMKFSEYIQALHAPVSLNLVRFAPLRGTALVSLDSNLVFTVVDNFFGGSGRVAKIEGRDFTSTENRVVQLVLRQVLTDLQEAWAPVKALRFEYLSSETNPHFINILSPSEIVVIVSFNAETEGGGGALQLTMPYSMIEPIRDLLDSSAPSEQAEGNDDWTRTLREEIDGVTLELAPLLGQAQLTLRQVLNFKAGDVIPCDFDGHVVLRAEGVPFFRGSFGASRGQQAVKIASRLPPPGSVRRIESNGAQP